VPTEEELKGCEEFLSEEEKGQLGATIKGLSSNPLADYWFKVLSNSDLISTEIKSADEPILRKLTNIEYLPNEDGKSFQLVFYFAENEYFSNKSVRTTYYLGTDEDDIPRKTVTEPILWNEKKNPAVQIVKKMQKNKKSGAKRVLEKEVENPSFFLFFKSINLEDEPDDQEEIEK